MNWINSIRPKIRSLLTTKRDVPENLWVKCPDTGQMVFYKDLEANQFVIPGSNHHMRMDAHKRLQHLFDGGEFEIVPVRDVAHDPLKFRDGKRYSDRLKTSKGDTELQDAVLVGEGTLEGQDVVAAAQDFRFMGGSLGMAAGEAVICGMLRAVRGARLSSCSPPPAERACRRASSRSCRCRAPPSPCSCCARRACRTSSC